MLKGAGNVIPGSIAALLLSVFLAACVHNHNITGTWQEPGKTSSIQFRRNGTFTATDDMGMTVYGNYILQAAGGIQFAIRNPDSSVEIMRGRITLQDDELRLANEGDKEVLIYRRIE